MTSLPIFVPGQTPDLGATTPESTFRWATVTDIDPLRVRLDGDTEGLPVTPSSLVNPLELPIGSRVWVQLFGRRLIVVGKGGGRPGSEVVKITDPAETQFVYSSAGWTFASSAASDTPTIVADGRTVQIGGRIRYTTASLAQATAYNPFYLPDRFAPVAGGPSRSMLACFTHGGSNAVALDMAAWIGLDASNRVALTLFAAGGQTTSWTSSVWIYFGGTWIRDYPTAGA